MTGWWEVSRLGSYWREEPTLDEEFSMRPVRSMFSRRALLGTTLGMSSISFGYDAMAQDSTLSSTQNTTQDLSQILAPDSLGKTERSDREPFPYSFNTATIMGQQLPLPDEVRIVAKAGYDAIEPWCRKIHEYVEKGESIPDLRKQIEDSGLTVSGAIAFGDWSNEDPQRSSRGFEEMRRDMDAVASIGGTRMAAPVGGLFNIEKPDLFALAERFAKLCELGREMGVRPCLEPWGGSKGFSRLGAVAMVLTECGDPEAQCCLDAYHTYKGGSDFAGMNLFRGSAIGVYHLNDYPADPPRETIVDGDRVMPGDGVAPLTEILQTLQRIGYQGPLSLEIFNQTYFAMDAYDVAVEGLAKMRGVVRKAFE